MGEKYFEETNNNEMVITSKELFAKWYIYYKLGLYEMGLAGRSDRDQREILFITKFPPVIGGVASQEYWRARSLAQNGFRVSVVTNANEADEKERAACLSKQELEYLNMEFPEVGGMLRTFFTEPSYTRNGQIRPEHYHIPMEAMAQSKLVGVALQVVETFRPGIVISGYMEPYAAAAMQIKQLTGIPHYLSFAGSDIDRLATIPELGLYYQYIFRNATCIATSLDKIPRLIGMNVPFYKVIPIPPPNFFPEDLFTPRAPKLIPADSEGTELTVGVYGKYNPYKCWEELLQAVADLRGRGRRVKLLCLMVGTNERFTQLIHDLDLRKYVQMVESVPIWNIPAFIRSCDIVCLLETGFPIKIHAPITPVEVGMCGVCPVLSREMKTKIRFPGLEENRNCLVVENARDVKSLVDVLEFALGDPNRIREYGHAAARDLREKSHFQQDLERYISILREGMGQKGNEFTDNGIWETSGLLHLLYVCHTFYPISLAGLSRYGITDFNDWAVYQTENQPLDLALAFGEYLETLRESHAIEDPLIIDAIRFENARVKSMKRFQGVNLMHIGQDFLRLAVFSDEKEVQLVNYVPIVLKETVVFEICSNIDECYACIGLEILKLQTTVKRKVFITSTNGLQTQVFLYETFYPLIELVDGKRSLAEIAYISNIPKNKTLKMLKVLSAAGVIGWKLVE